MNQGLRGGGRGSELSTGGGISFDLEAAPQPWLCRRNGVDVGACLSVGGGN